LYKTYWPDDLFIGGGGGGTCWFTRREEEEKEGAGGGYPLPLTSQHSPLGNLKETIMLQFLFLKKRYKIKMPRKMYFWTRLLK
jgi:hypothetical protein